MTILTSTNGTDWEPRGQDKTGADLWALAHAKDGRWVAVGDDGTIFTSTNGTDWARQAAGSNVAGAR